MMKSLLVLSSLVFGAVAQTAKDDSSSSSSSSTVYDLDYLCADFHSYTFDPACPAAWLTAQFACVDPATAPYPSFCNGGIEQCGFNPELNYELETFLTANNCCSSPDPQTNSYGICSCYASGGCFPSGDDSSSSSSSGSSSGSSFEQFFCADPTSYTNDPQCVETYQAAYLQCYFNSTDPTYPSFCEDSEFDFTSQCGIDADFNDDWEQFVLDGNCCASPDQETGFYGICSCAAAGGDGCRGVIFDSTLTTSDSSSSFGIDGLSVICADPESFTGSPECAEYYQAISCDPSDPNLRYPLLCEEEFDCGENADFDAEVEDFATNSGCCAGSVSGSFGVCNCVAAGLCEDPFISDSDSSDSDTDSTTMAPGTDSTTVTPDTNSSTTVAPFVCSEQTDCASCVIPGVGVSDTALLFKCMWCNDKCVDVAADQTEVDFTTDADTAVTKYNDVCGTSYLAPRDAEEAVVNAAFFCVLGEDGDDFNSGANVPLMPSAALTAALLVVSFLRSLL
jgi:hypothetical protein